MGENTKIEWAHHTFNPWIGCTKVSPGCANCYAETLMDKRLNVAKWGKGNPRTRTSQGNWSQPRRWDRAAAVAKERPRVFCASLADWLDDEVPRPWRTDLLELIEQTTNLDWLLLTKRPENLWALTCGEVPRNVWLGVTAENQEQWDKRLPQLMQWHGRVRFVSAEPLLGPIHMGDIKPDWVIAGGESGPGARPVKYEWVIDLVGQCLMLNVPVFFKQWGGVNKKAAGRLLDGKTYEQVPE